VRRGRWDHFRARGALLGCTAARSTRTLGGAGDDVDLLYATTLIIATAAGALALLTSVLAFFRPSAQIEPKTPIWRVLLSHHLTNGALALGVLSLAISVLVHSRWGHGPGTVAPMEFERLMSEHEAFPTVGVILILGLALSVYRRQRQRHGSAT